MTLLSSARPAALLMMVAACSTDAILQPSAADVDPTTRAFATASWETRAPRLTPSGYGVAVVHLGRIYSFGGFHGHLGENATTQIYDPATDSWSSAAAPLQRSAWPVATAAGKVYLFGGWNGSSESLTTEVYDLATNTWSTAASVPAAHLLGVAAEIGGRIIVAAGSGNFSGPPPFTDIYDPLTNIWSQGAPIPQSRSFVGGAAIDGKLYVAGGVIADGSRVATLDVYDPTTNTWATKTPMPTARGAAGVLAVDGKLWVAGGSTNNPDFAASLTNVVEIYDPVTDTWTTGTPMNTSRQAPQMALLEGTVHAIAGHSATSGLSVHEAYVTAAPNPVTKDECRKGGWAAFGFRNQGQCIRFVETGMDSR